MIFEYGSKSRDGNPQQRCSEDRQPAKTRKSAGSDFLLVMSRLTLPTTDDTHAISIVLPLARSQEIKVRYNASSKHKGQAPTVQPPETLISGDDFVSEVESSLDAELGIPNEIPYSEYRMKLDLFGTFGPLRGGWTYARRGGGSVPETGHSKGAA